MNVKLENCWFCPCYLSLLALVVLRASITWRLNRRGRARVERNMSKIHPEVIAPDASGYNKNPEILTDKKVDKKLEVNNCNLKSVTPQLYSYWERGWTVWTKLKSTNRARHWRKRHTSKMANARWTMYSFIRNRKWAMRMKTLSSIVPSIWRF